MEEEHDEGGTEREEKQKSDLLKNYNRFVAPPNKNPQLVRMDFAIFGFSDVSELNMDFTVSYFMRIAWRDDRLRFTPEHYGNVSYIILHPEEMHKIWRPDIFYRNEKGDSISKPFSVSNSASRVYPSGEVYFLRKLETKFRCEMKLQNYPFDIQMCYMDISTVAFTRDLLQFHDSAPVDFYSDIELTSIELLEVDTENRNLSVKSDTYDSVMIIFKFRRFINFYILQVKKNSVANMDKMGTRLSHIIFQEAFNLV